MNSRSFRIIVVVVVEVVDVVVVVVVVDVVVVVPNATTVESEDRSNIKLILEEKTLDRPHVPGCFSGYFG